MKSRPLDNYRFHHLAAELFATMFYPFDDEIIKFLQEWLNIATLNDIRIISGILKKAGSDFVFTQRSFVAGFLEKVKPYGKKQLDSNISDLYGAAISGSWSGTLGEPSEKHLRLKRESEKALHEIQRFSAAYRLYEDIYKDAEEEIKRSLQEREKLDN